MSVVRLSDRNPSCGPCDENELRAWIKEWADEICEGGEFEGAQEIVILCHDSAGLIKVRSLSLRPRFDTIELVGMLTIAAAQKATGP